MSVSPRTRRTVSRVALAVLVIIVALFVAQVLTGNDQPTCPATSPRNDLVLTG